MGVSQEVQGLDEPAAVPEQNQGTDQEARSYKVEDRPLGRGCNSGLRCGGDGHYDSPNAAHPFSAPGNRAV